MEADLAYRGVDFRDFYRPRGGPSRLTLRRLAVLLRHLPRQSSTATAQGGDGFSMLELVVMEVGHVGPLSFRHPYHESERASKAERARALRERQEQFKAKAADLTT